jgi:PKD repeat protein
MSNRAIKKIVKVYIENQNDVDTLSNLDLNLDLDIWEVNQGYLIAMVYDKQIMEMKEKGFVVEILYNSGREFQESCFELRPKNLAEGGFVLPPSQIIPTWEENKPAALYLIEYFQQLDIKSPPIASFSYYPENPIVNETITFNASNSTDSDGTIENYEWDFGDGEIAEGEIVIHSYSSAKNYTVKLTVTDNEGATNSTAEIIHVGVGVAVATASIKTPSGVSEGENFTATVNIDNVSDLAILMFQLNYNSLVIQLTNVEGGYDISTSGWSHWLQDSNAGILKVFAFSDPSGSPINGDAELARLEFTAVRNAGNKSVIDIYGILGNSAVEPIEAIWEGSEVAVI